MSFISDIIEILKFYVTTEAHNEEKQHFVFHVTNQHRKKWQLNDDMVAVVLELH